MKSRKFLIADTHFYHRNIIKWREGFTSIEDHNATLIRNWKSVVSEEDTIYILGDFYLGKMKLAEDLCKDLLERLPGKKILVIGNHDLSFNASKWSRLGFDRVVPMAEVEGCLLTHIPIHENEIASSTSDGRWLLNIHGHLHSMGNTKELLDKGYFCVSAECVDYTPIEFKEIWNKFSNSGLESRFKNINFTNQFPAGSKITTPVKLKHTHGVELKLYDHITLKRKTGCLHNFNHNIIYYCQEYFSDCKKVMVVDNNTGIAYYTDSKHWVGLGLKYFR